MFVDGDDVLDIRTIELLVEIALENDVSLVTCKYKKISCTEDFKGGQLGPVEVVSGDRLLESLLLLDGESGSACAKLYAKKLLPLLVFPDGQLFEDFGVEATVFSTIDKACIFDAELYGYLAREGLLPQSRVMVMPSSTECLPLLMSLGGLCGKSLSFLTPLHVLRPSVRFA